MKKWIWLVVILLVVGGAGYGGYRAYSGAANADEATPVRIEQVESGDLVELVQAPGDIQPRTKVSISARVAARIKELPFEEGDQVKSGDVVVRLDSTDLQAALKQSEARYAAQKAQITVSEARVRAQRANVEAAKTILADVKRDMDRQMELLASRDVSQSSFDSAKRRFDEQTSMVASSLQMLAGDEANLIVLQHTLEAAEADITRARDNLSYTTISSPIDGVVTRLNNKIGELVVTGTMNTPGTVILEVADFSEMLMEARVDEANIASVQPGQRGVIQTQAYPDRKFSGVVEKVALAQSGGGGQQIQQASSGRYFKVEILMEGEGEQLFSGLTADVDIETKRHTGVLKVQSQCVLGRPTDELPVAVRDDPNVDKKASQTTVVFKVVDDKAILAPVVVGPSDLTHTIIKAGLTAEDKLITGPYKVLEKVTHEQKVKDDRATTQPTTKPATEKSAMRGEGEGTLS